MYYSHDLIKSRFESILKNESEFNNFEGITKEYIEKIRENMNERREHSKTKGEWHTKLLLSIVDSRTGVKIESFDKKLIHLIEGFDPYCYTSKKFAEMGKPGNKIKMKEIQKLTGDKKTIALLKEKTELKSFQNDIEEKLGYLEPKLIKYEGAYLRFLNKLGLRNENLQDILSLLTLDTLDLNLLSIPDEKYQEIIENTGKTNIFAPKSLSSIISSMKYKYNSIEENILELIYSLDPEFDILNIYIDNVRYEDIYRELKNRKNIQTYGNTDKQLLKKLVKLEAALPKRAELQKKWTI